MQNITIGQIATTVAMIGGLITGFALLKNWTEKWLNIMLKEQFDEIKKEMSAINKRIDKLDLESCKNYLVSFLSGVEAGQEISEMALERFYEQYERYAKVYAGNGYIKSKFEQLQREGKLISS